MEDYDRTYRETTDYFGPDPDPLLARFLPELPPRARVLDIGAGQGRNALPAAAAGHRVTGIDPSAEALEQCRARAVAVGVDLELQRCDFADHAPDAPYNAILCFGLLQTLSRTEGASLVHRLHAWSRTGTLVLLRAWHVDDPSYERVRSGWTRAGLHSFRDEGGEHRTYLARGAVRNFVRGWEVLHHEEGMGSLHRHGDGPEHRHGDVELAARRR